MKGLGDSIYQRAAVRALARTSIVSVATPWPELYQDLGVDLRPSGTTLRTQAKNESRPRTWSPARRGSRNVRASYSAEIRNGSSIRRAIEASVGVTTEGRLELPRFEAPACTPATPFVVVRPLTVRTEWTNTARNAEPEQLDQVVAWIRALGYQVVSVADVDDKVERLVAPVEADLRLENGELPVEQLLGLVAAASAVVGGVGWIVPACQAFDVPAFVLLGGNGAHNGIRQLVDERDRPTRTGFAVPDRFCVCSRMDHACDKRNTNLEAQFGEWQREQLPRRGAR